MALSRRAFVLGLTALGASATAQLRPRVRATPPVLKPPRLRDGDRVALVNPVSVVPGAQEVEDAALALAGVGLRVLRTEGLRRVPPSDRARADEINGLFEDGSVRAIVALRGGWGCAGLLPHLDYALIRRNPKVVLGFSDVVALLVGLHSMTGLVTFHGPTGVSPWSVSTVEHLRRLLFAAELPSLGAADGITVRPGRARGRLLGGNLTVLSSLAGSPYVNREEDLVLFLEEISEPYSEVDRMLTQLSLAGLLDGVRAVVFGGCAFCGPPALDTSLTLPRVLERHFASRRLPIFVGAPIGHIEAQLTIPIGIEADVDAERRTVRLLEPAVS